MTFKTQAVPQNPFAEMGMPSAPPPTDHLIAELVLHPGARVNHFEEKAAFNPMWDLYSLATSDVTPGDAIRKKDVVDLTSKMRPDGSLDWTPPEGHWVVLRFGYSLLGITNHPATKEATGLEVDKLNAGYVKNYMNGYLDSYKETVGADMIGKRGIRYVITDSWEAGAQNWTDDNEVSVKVINAWVNRLIGDLQPDATTKYTFSAWKAYKPDSPLVPSGLLGPVRIESILTQ